MINRNVLFLVSTVMILGVSCQKRELNKDTASAQDNSISESVFDDVLSSVEQAGNDSSVEVSNKRNSIYGDPIWDSVRLSPEWPDTTWPKTVTVYFNDGVTGSDGKIRKGTITAVYTGRYEDEDSKVTISTSDYEVDGYKVVGSRTVTNVGENANGNTEFSVTAKGTITDPDGDVFTWESTRTREWTQGQDTRFWSKDGNGNYYLFTFYLDDVYSITGSASGTNRDGLAYTVTITEPLIVEVCNWLPEVTEGVLEIQPADLKVRTIDYGDGECDGKANVSVGNKTLEFNLR